MLCQRNPITFHCDVCTDVKSVKCEVLHSATLDVLIMQSLVHCRGAAYRVIQCRGLIGVYRLFGALLGPFLSGAKSLIVLDSVIGVYWPDQ